MKPSALRILLATVAAVLLALATVFDWSYGYYNLLRVAVSLCSAYLAWFAVTSDRRSWAITFGVLVLLFNPLLPIYLTRGIWQVLDVVAAGPTIAGVPTGLRTRHRSIVKTIRTGCLTVSLPQVFFLFANTRCSLAGAHHSSTK
jgi:hypothetical protein